VLVTTHQPEEAARCDRLAVLDHGHVIACETPADLLRRVGGDVIRIEADHLDDVRAEVLRHFELAEERVQVIDGELRIEAQRGHELIPRLVEHFPGRLRAVGMRPPSLGDAFVRLTGRGLGGN
jgi:ABC-2 type transport system ATP-binding protein